MDIPEKKLQSIKIDNCQGVYNHDSLKAAAATTTRNNKQIHDCWFRWRRVNIGVQLTQQEL